MNTANESSLKKLAWIPMIAMGVLFVMGMVYFKERALFSDAAFRIFHVINSGKFDLPGNRYGAFFVQLLPYLARQAHTSVNVILFLFGSSYNLFYFLSATVVICWFKNYKLGLLMALYYFLFASESYIWVSEVLQGTACMFLSFAAVIAAGNKRANVMLTYVFAALFAFLAIFSHFVVIIPMVYLLVYFILEERNWPFSKKGSIRFAVTILAIIGLNFLNTNNDYDNMHLHGVTHVSPKDIIEAFSRPTVTIFYYRCLVNYWAGLLIFIVGLVALVRDKKKYPALWTFTSAVGYIILMGLTYGDMDNKAALFHIESEWSCIAIIVATPFVYNYLPKLKNTTAAWLLSGVFAIRLVYIVIAIQPFIQLTDLKERVLTRMHERKITKLAISEDDQLAPLITRDWTYSYESIMMSAMRGYEPRLTFFFFSPDDKKLVAKLSEARSYYDAWTMIPGSSQNQEYFTIDTTQPYQVMTAVDLFRDLPPVK